MNDWWYIILLILFMLNNSNIKKVMLVNTIPLLDQSSLKYSFDLSWSGTIVLAPGFHPAGQTTPCWSACWKAWIILIVSSTFRPTCSSLMVMDRIFPFPSITKSPLRVAPLSPSSGSSTKTPYSLEISLVMSAKRGILICPRPPFSLGVFFQARCEKWESTEIPITSAPISKYHARYSWSRSHAHCSWWSRWGRHRWSQMDRTEAQRIFHDSRRASNWQKSYREALPVLKTQERVVLGRAREPLLEAPGWRKDISWRY